MNTAVAALALVGALHAAGCKGSGGSGGDDRDRPALPVARDDTAVARDGQPVTIAVLENDADPRGRALTLASVGAPAHGTAVISGASIVYTPSAADFLGTDAFSYAVTSGGAEATATVAVRGVQSLVLHGRVYDGPVAYATVAVTSGGQTFTATADGGGFYALPLDVSDASAVLVLEATGAASQPQVALASLLGSYGWLCGGGAPPHALAAAAVPALDVTNVSTARYGLVTAANAGVPPATDAQVIAAEKAVNANDLLRLAAVIKVAVDPPAYALPAGCADTLALATSSSCLDAFVAAVTAAAGGPAPIDQARAAILADPQLTPSLAPAGQPKAFGLVYAARPGAFSRFGWVLRLDASGGTGAFVSADRNVPITWADDAGTIVVSAATPLWQALSVEDIRTSPAPQPVKDAYVAEHGTTRVTVDQLGVSMRLHPIARGALVTWVDEVDHLRNNWDFVVGAQAYHYVSEADARSGAELREQADPPEASWTPALATGTWALNVYYAPGVGVGGVPWPAEFNGDVVTLAADGTGSSWLTARALTWSVGGGLLHLAFSDGSSQRVRIVDAADPAYALWSEHRDAGGALVAGIHDLGFRAAGPAAATEALFATAAGEYWQTLVNAWAASAWIGDALDWQQVFGWRLASGGGGEEVSLALGDTFFGPPLTHRTIAPLGWSVGSGQARIERYAFPSGENRAYRLLTPVAASGDGRRLYVVEEERRRQTATSAYELWIPPRLNYYDRHAIPTLGGACSAVAHAAAPIQDDWVHAAWPTPAGGAVADGTYHLTRAGTYRAGTGTPGTFGDTLRATLVVAGGVADVVFSDAASGEVRGTFSLAFAAAEPKVTFTPTCGGGTGQAPSTLYYTAGGGELRLYDGNMTWESVYVRQ